MGVKITNNATSTLAGSISDTDLSLAVQGGDASLFPAIGVGEWFYVTLEDASLNREVMKVTARVGATLTVTRGQDGFAARAWNAGDKIECRLNFAALQDLTNVGDAVNGATAATTMADTDRIGFWQAAGTALRHITWANFYEAVRTKLGAMVSANTAKSTPVDADQLLMSDSASSNASVKLSWLNLKAGIWTALGALINGGTAKTTPVGADAIAIMDSAASNATKKLTFTNLVAYLATALGGGREVGEVIDYAGATIPAKWLACYGQNVSRTTYSALFTAIGTAHGAGDGSTTFTLPDLRGRVVAGKDDMGGTSANRLTGLSGGLNGDNLGATGGAETHTLTTAQLASHSHSIITSNSAAGSAGPPAAGNTSTVSSGSTSNAGSDNAHNNVQPTAILNKIIYAGV